MTAQQSIRHNDRVEATAERWAPVTKRFVRVGTRGEVLGLRTDPDGRKFLVKFKGFGWPVQMTKAQIRKV